MPRFSVIIKLAFVGVLSFCCLQASAQSICFWTNDEAAVPIRIYIDEQYVGDVTAAYDFEPSFARRGCLYLNIRPGKHMLTAINKYGQVYNGWNGSIRPRLDRVNMVQIYSGLFSNVDRTDIRFSFIDWDYFIYDSTPYHHRPRHHIDNLDPDDDRALLIAMAATAVAGTALMTAAVVRNWSFPDNRFPYFSLGVGSELLSGLSIWRHTARARVRFGNLGGLSLLADAGVSSAPVVYMNDYDPFFQQGAHNPFTWSIGAGLDYGAFCFGLRYKAPHSGSLDTFLVADCHYDWWIANHIGINFHLGFGISGYGLRNHLLDNFEAPLGISLMFKL